MTLQELHYTSGTESKAKHCPNWVVIWSWLWAQTHECFTKKTQPPPPPPPTQQQQKKTLIKPKPIFPLYETACSSWCFQPSLLQFIWQEVWCGELHTKKLMKNNEVKWGICIQRFNRLCASFNLMVMSCMSGQRRRSQFAVGSSWLCPETVMKDCFASLGQYEVS